MLQQRELSSFSLAYFAGLDFAGLFRVVDHGVSDSVLDAAARLHYLKLGDDLAACTQRKVAEGDEDRSHGRSRLRHSPAPAVTLFR